jgi:mannose-6-phosphate isomerase-like protein (cupin superfamily)
VATTPCDPRVVASGEGRRLSVVGDFITIKLRGSDTNGVCSVVEEETPPQGGPPPHRHQREDEVFFVLEGHFDVRIADKTVEAPPGTHLFVPKGTPHAFKNVGTTTGRVLVTILPAGFERFFEEVHELGQQGPVAIEVMATLAQRYGLEFL